MKVVAKIIIKNSKSKILVLVRSSTHPIFANHLDFPGGDVEINENNISGIIREISEETDLDLSSSRIILLFNKKINKNLTHVLYGYQLDEVNPQLNISWEHSEYKWLNEDELLRQKLPVDVDPYYRNVIDFLLEKSKAKI